MHVFVVGGTGFIGAHVARHLASSGHRVTVFHRGQTDADLPGSVEHLHGARADLPGLRRDLERMAPDVAVDMISFTQAEARTVASAFDGLARRLVVISSGDVYRAYDGLRGAEDVPHAEGPLAEDAPLRTTRYPYRAHAEGPEDRLYHYDKIEVEAAARSFSGAFTVLRLAKVYGPRDAQHHAWPYLKRMIDGRPVILLGEQQATWRWTRVYVENAAAAIAHAATDARAADTVYNVGAPDTLTERAWVEALGQAVGWTGHIVPLPADAIPTHLQLPFDWSYDMALDTRRLHHDLGFTPPVPRAEAVRRTYEYVRAHPPAAPAEAFDYAAEDAAWSDGDG